MTDGVIAAIIGGAATIAAAVLGLVASIRKAQAIASLANIEDKRALSAAEVEAIKVQASVAEQLGAAPPPEAASGRVNVRLVYPGISRFRSYSQDITSTTYVSVSYSNIDVMLDGQSIGGGDGERGFQLNFDTVWPLNCSVNCTHTSKGGGPGLRVRGSVPTRKSPTVRSNSSNHRYYTQPG